MTSRSSLRWTPAPSPTMPDLVEQEVEVVVEEQVRWWRRNQVPIAIILSSLGATTSPATWERVKDIASARWREVML
jgi:hypothetical protein